MDQHIVRGDTGLSGVDAFAEGDAFGRNLQIGCRIDDDRVFAAQLQGDGDEVLRGVLHDQAAGRRLAGEGDLGDAVRGGQRLAALQAEAVDIPVACKTHRMSCD